MKRIVAIVSVCFCLIVFLTAIFAQEKASDLQTIIRNKDAKTIKQEVDELIRQNDMPAFTALSDALITLDAQPDIEIYWTVVCGMAALTNEEAMSKTAEFIVQHKDDKYGKSVLAAWRSNQSPLKISLLKSIKANLSGETLNECIRQLEPKPAKLIDKDAKSIKAYRDLSIVQRLDKNKIIVVRNDLCDENIKKAGMGFDGNYDHIQDTLAELGIPFTLIGKSELEKASYSLHDKWILIFNCNFFKDHCCNPEHIKIPPPPVGTHPVTWKCPGVTNCMVHNSKLSTKCILKIKQFAENGGYLFTEALNMEEILENAFKGIITHTKYLPEKSVVASPYPNAILHPYLRYVFEFPPVAEPISKTTEIGDFSSDIHWKIDEQSSNIKILKKDQVTILIASPELTRRNKDEGAMAVTFSFANNAVQVTPSSPAIGGQVLHIMSHFNKQKSNVDEFTLQNLLVNFLEDCAARHQAQKAQKEGSK